METNDSIWLTAELRPVIYDDFHCLMGACRMSCCKGGWEITFDRKDYLKIKKQKGSPELNRRLEHFARRNREDGFYAGFVLQEGVCPLLREDGLCLLQREKGENILPLVCKEFPRWEVLSYSGYLERSLSPACEGVLALLWQHPEGLEFCVDPLPGRGRRAGMSFEANCMTENFQEIRSLCIDFLQDRRRPLPHRILLMGFALKALTEDSSDVVPRFLERGRYLLEQGDAEALLGNADEPRAQELALHNNIYTLMLLWKTDENKREFLDDLTVWLSVEIHNSTLQINRAAYRSARERYRERFSDYFMENLMVSLFFQLGIPDVRSVETLWKSYVNFCNLYSVYQFAGIMSCREGAPGDRDELFRLLVAVSRSLIHNPTNQHRLRDEFFQNDSATLAHMAVLLCGT